MSTTEGPTERQLRLRNALERAIPARRSTDSDDAELRLTAAVDGATRLLIDGQVQQTPVGRTVWVEHDDHSLAWVLTRNDTVRLYTRGGEAGPVSKEMQELVKKKYFSESATT